MMHRCPSSFRRLVRRTALYVCVLVFARGSVGFAQGTTSGVAAPPSQAGARQPSGPMGSLEITPEQKQKLDAIATKHADEGKAVSQLFQTDPAEAMKRMVALRARMQKEMRLVLTTEQRAIFDRNVAEMNAQMDAHMPSTPR